MIGETIPTRYLDKKLERERERSRSDDEFEGSVPRKENTEILQRKIWVFFRALRRRDRVRAGVEYSVRKNQSAGC